MSVHASGPEFDARRHRRRGSAPNPRLTRNQTRHLPAAVPRKAAGLFLSRCSCEIHEWAAATSGVAGSHCDSWKRKARVWPDPASQNGSQEPAWQAGVLIVSAKMRAPCVLTSRRPSLSFCRDLPKVRGPRAISASPARVTNAATTMPGERLRQIHARKMPAMDEKAGTGLAAQGIDPEWERRQWR